MALTRRQAAFYKDTVDVYRIAGYEKTGVSVKQPVYSSSPVESDLRCRIQTTVFRNSFVPPMGRSQLDNFETEDMLHCEIGTDLQDADVVIVTTTGSPLNGKAYKVIGKGEVRIGKANYEHVHIRLLDEAPANITV